MTSRPIGIPCPLCHGRTRSVSGTPCSKCHATGWIVKPLDQLSPEETRTIRQELREHPLDSDTAHDLESTRQQLTATLTRRWIESVVIPEGEATHIDLVGKRDILRIQPEFTGGKFRNLTAIPLPAI